MNINREKFEAWLSIQPRDRVFDYSNIRECVVCSFIKETTNLMPRAGGHSVDIYNKNYKQLKTIPFPEWLLSLLNKTRITNNIYSSKIIGGKLQKTYEEMFPDDSGIVTPKLEEKTLLIPA